MYNSRKDSINYSTILSTLSINPSSSSDDFDEGFLPVTSHKKRKIILYPLNKTAILRFWKLALEMNRVLFLQVPLMMSISLRITLIKITCRFQQFKLQTNLHFMLLGVESLLPQHVKDDLVSFCKQKHDFGIKILHGRSSCSISNANDNNFLIHVKNVQSFYFLLNPND